jgi:hypothetical protein
MTRSGPDNLSDKLSARSRRSAIGWFGNSIPGDKACERRNGVAVGQAPTQIPQLMQFDVFTTASISNDLPSLLGIIEIALNGQSS